MITPSKPLGKIIIETDLGDALLSNGKTAREVKEFNGHVVIETILQAANRTNRNRRRYPGNELFPQLTCPRTNELIASKNMKSENGHPMSKDLARQSTIDPNNTVSVFSKFWTDGDLVMGWTYGDFNQKGDEFDRQVRAGQMPSWSLRALGTLVPTKAGTEVRNMKFITYDRVIYPSHPEAYTQGFVYENAVIEAEEAACQEGSRIIIPEGDKGLVIPILNESVINYIKSESTNLKYLKEDFDFMYENIEIMKDPITKSSSVKLTDTDGNIVLVNLESYIADDIMDYCANRV